MEIQHLQPYALAILVGLLVGIERERAHPEPEGTMGVRTFLLLSLLGALAGAMDNDWAAAAAAAFAFLLVTAAYVNGTRKPRPDFGLTTEVAAGVVFFLGYLSHRSPVTVALLGPLVALVLFSKQRLHRFTHRIKAAELNAALLILLLGVAVVNLVEDSALDPWGLFNPRKFGILVLVLAVLEFSSYLAVKLLGDKASALAVGFLGGLVSSTAVTLSSARTARANPSSWRLQVVSTLSAQISALGELLFLVALISLPLAGRMAPAMGGAFAFSALALWWLSRKTQGRSRLELNSPLDIKGVLRLAVLLALVLGAIGAVQKLLGEKGTALASFLTGLFELHGVSIATATLHAQQQISLDGARQSLAAAVLASFTSKIFLGWLLARGPFALWLTLVFVATGGVFAALAWLW